MLGRIHGSVEHFYVPKLITLDKEGEVSVKNGDKPKSHTLFVLGWDLVDEFKAGQYIRWVEMHWKEKFPSALKDKFPATLPPRYDTIIKGLVFALPQKYHSEILHFTQLYYTERHRARSFDTTVREMCLQVSQAAINCAFKLLADCVYDAEKQTWFREDAEVDKHLIQCLLMYKFWRGATGDGLVWDHAALDKLEESAAFLEKEPYRGTKVTTMMYRRCLGEIRAWEEEQEKFRSFVGADVKLEPCYYSQEVHGELATINDCVVSGTLQHLPFIPGTVTIRVGLPNSQPICTIKFDEVGKPEIIAPEKKSLINATSMWLKSDGKYEINLKVRGSDTYQWKRLLTSKVVATVDYEYQLV
jgi:hypothetical protein